MAWSDLFRQAREFAQGMGGWFNKQSSPQPPPRYQPAPPPQYNPAPPPPFTGYQTGDPPIQNFNVLYQRIIDLANRAQDPNVSAWQGWSQMQEALQNTQEMLQYPMPPDMRRQMEESKGRIQRWLQDFQRSQQPPPGTPPPTTPPPPLRPPPGAGPSPGEPPPRPGEEEDDDDDVQEMQELVVADVQNWPEEYREKVFDEAVVTKTPGSSNVYSFVWVSDEHTITEDGGVSINLYGQRSSEVGTLIVTFKEWMPGMKQSQRPNTPGSTYAYAGVSRTIYQQFLAATSPDSAGFAVWDYLRIRGTQSGHRYAYRLISVTGDYVPRMATPYGFRRRRHKGLVVSTEEERQGEQDDLVPWIKTTLTSTLRPGPLTRFGQVLPPEMPQGETGTSWSSVAYRTRRNRGGYPNRGAPNRGTPNRGRP